MPSLRLAGVVGLAWSGVVVGHGVGYAGENLGAPNLAATGHGSFSVALVSGIAILPAVLSLLAVRALNIGKPSEVLHPAAWLAGIQLPIFAVMELVERGMAVDVAVLDPSFLIGVVLQLLVVLVSSVLMAVLVRVLRSLVGPLCLRAGGGGERSRIPVDPYLSPLVCLIAVRLRAPPSLLIPG